MEHATLLGLVGLAVSVMQNDEAQGRAFISTLSQPGVQDAAKAIVERLSAMSGGEG
jgi:hypothetical protein